MKHVSEPNTTPGCRPQQRLVGHAWRRVGTWARAQTFAPAWLPRRLRLPVFSYLAAVIIESLAVALTLLLEYTLPAFSHRSLLVILGVVLVALTWAADPVWSRRWSGSSSWNFWSSRPP